MTDKHIVATMWMLAAVAVVCFFAALVSRYETDANGSYVETPRTTTTYHGR